MNTPDIKEERHQAKDKLMATNLSNRTNETMMTMCSIITERVVISLLTGRGCHVDVCLGKW